MTRDDVDTVIAEQWLHMTLVCVSETARLAALEHDYDMVFEQWRSLCDAAAEALRLLET